MIRSEVIDPPASEPLSLSEVKLWLKIDGTDEDGLIFGLITSARLTVEAITGLILVAQTMRFHCPLWPEKKWIDLPHRPISTLLAARLRDRQGAVQALPIEGFGFTNDGSARVTLPDLSSGAPSAMMEIEIDAVMGFGSDPIKSPPPLLTAMKMLIAYWYENRGEDSLQGSGLWPKALDAVLHPFCMPRL